jgi:hypothetical protein
MGSPTRKLKQKGRIPLPGPYQCHPRVGAVRPAEGCLPRKILESAARDLQRPIPIPKSGTALRKALEKALHVEPNHEHSFLSKLPVSSEMKRRLQTEYLRPPMPSEWKSDPDTWLDSLNIADVMNQFEEVYPKFEFMGPFPIDFAAPNPYEKDSGKCLMNEMCELRVTKALHNGTDSIGIVYNLDPHFKSGSHWVANFVDLKNHMCYYFDSYGMKPPHQVEKFMRWLTTQDPTMKLAYSARRLQYKNTECGVYSIYFIIRMLLGDEFTEFSRRKPTDADMLQLRNCLFST